MWDRAHCADLTPYAALTVLNQSHSPSAQRSFDRALDLFDGVGFADKAFDGRYATYKPSPGLLQKP